MKSTLSFSALAAVCALAAISNASAQTVVVPATPPPVVAPAPVPGGVTVVAPGGTVVAPGTTTTTTTTKVITSDGVVEVYEPGTRFVVKETTGPVSYTYGPDVVYSTPGGVVLTAEQVRTRMRAGLPINVEYVNEGDTRIIRRVIIRD